MYYYCGFDRLLRGTLPSLRHHEKGRNLTTYMKEKEGTSTTRVDEFVKLKRASDDGGLWFGV